MNTPAISVIAPVYNVERYIRQFMDSVLQQTFTDIELIMVNDKSPDNCLAICNEYAAKDKRVVVIDKPKNEGCERARFTGLAAARGKYVYVPDPDDYISTRKAFELMYNKAEETGADLVQMRRRPIFNSYSPFNFYWLGPWPGEGLIEQPQLREELWPSFFCDGKHKIFTTMWAKLYRKEVLDRAELKPSGVGRYDDMMFNLQVWPYLKSIYCINKVGYCYRWPWVRAFPKLKFAKQRFAFQREIMEKHGFYKVADGSALTLLDELKSDIALHAKTESENEVVVWLEGELQDPLWDVATDIRERRDVLDAPFTQAVHNKDAQKCYEIVRDMRPSIRARIQRRVISFAYLLLRYL